MQPLLNSINSIVWGPVTIILLMGSGIFLSIILRGIQIRKIFYSLKLLSGHFDNPDDAGEITHFQALSAALSATIGTGNIAGVATAIALGGPGAIFWMWITAIFGMALKYAECLLSLKYRIIHENGAVGAGPMYYLEHGLGQRYLGILFAIFAVIASFGIGNMTQANSVAEPMLAYFGIPKIVTGLSIGILVFFVIVGGIKRIGQVASKLVPIMVIFYITGALIIIIDNIGSVPHALGIIFQGAFSEIAATGGFTGAAVSQALRFGIARGLFSNEAGLGSAPIAHGAAKTKEPVREGLVAMLGPLIDTILICTMTALVIILTGAYKLGLSGANLTARSFDTGIPGFGGYIVAISIIFFAFSTAISWSYYGDRCIDYLFGEKMVMPYRIVYCLILPIGAIFHIDLVWTISDIGNALMACPNLIGLILLWPVVLKSTREYFSDPARVFNK